MTPGESTGLSGTQHGGVLLGMIIVGVSGALFGKRHPDLPRHFITSGCFGSAIALAALALKQSRGDMIEAIFLLRAYRTTLPRFGTSRPIETGDMRVERRVSATYKDLPGGQLLGPTFDYTHRLLDPSLLEEDAVETGEQREEGLDPVMRVSDILDGEGLIEPDGEMPEDHIAGDITREPMEFPMPRDLRLQALARGDEGFLLALGYSTQRGYGRTHPFVGEIRMGLVEVEFDVPEL
eukprot:gene144-159_t